MLKKTITYTDYNGVERTEDYYFNLTEAELTEMEMSTSGGFAEMLKSIVDSKDIPAVMEVFKKIILKSYGEKSPDGKYFRKSEELCSNFASTEAYSKLYMELYQDTDAATKFINGIIPSNLQAKVAELEKKNNVVALPEA